MQQTKKHISEIACKLKYPYYNCQCHENTSTVRRYVLASALRDMNQTTEITEAPKDCDNSGSIWETGKTLFNFIRNQVLLNGSTGKVAFDDQGDRINAEYDVINIQLHQAHMPVGKYYFDRVNTIDNLLNYIYIYLKLII